MMSIAPASDNGHPTSPPKPDTVSTTKHDDVGEAERMADVHGLNDEMCYT